VILFSSFLSFLFYIWFEISMARDYDSGA